MSTCEGTLQISGDDPDDYKRTLKGQLKRVLDSERDVPGGAAEFVIAYVQAAGADTSSNFLKSSKKAMLLSLSSLPHLNTGVPSSTRLFPVFDCLRETSHRRLPSRQYRHSLTYRQTCS